MSANDYCSRIRETSVIAAFPASGDFGDDIRNFVNCVATSPALFCTADSVSNDMIVNCRCLKVSRQQSHFPLNGDLLFRRNEQWLANANGCLAIADCRSNQTELEN